MSRQRKIQDLGSKMQKERLEKKMALLEKRNLNSYTNRQVLQTAMSSNDDNCDETRMYRLETNTRAPATSSPIEEDGLGELFSF